MRFVVLALLVISTTNAENVIKSQLRESRDIKDNQETCEPGKLFKDYCNTCFCGSDGNANNADCTRKYCNPDHWHKNGTLKNSAEFPTKTELRKERDIKENQETCEPRKLFNNYCNTCICGSDGNVNHAACTKTYCVPNHWNKDGTLKNSAQFPTKTDLRKERDIKENQETCEPGKTFNKYCNICFCGSDGNANHAACTRMYCDPDHWNKDGTLKNSAEFPTKTELRKERDIKENQETCEPGKTFNKYCNICFCGSDGNANHAACTRMYCDPDHWNKNGTLKNSAEFPTKTELRKERDIKENQETCEPGKLFKEYCNTCFCGSSGDANTAFCTRMYCDPDIWNKDGTLKNSAEFPTKTELRKERDINEKQETCEPLKSFKEYCNTCFCGSSGDANTAYCTRMYCDPDIWNKDGTVKSTNATTGTRCRPGDIFQNFCNTCLCGTDGLLKNARCTKMYCDPEEWNKDGSLKSSFTRKERSSELLCQPGKIIKDDCNTCSCDRNGKIAGCTLLRCPSKKEERVSAPQVCDPKKYFKIDCNHCICSEDGLQIACTKINCSHSAK